jgi:hypothetical protein
MHRRAGHKLADLVCDGNLACASRADHLNVESRTSSKMNPFACMIASHHSRAPTSAAEFIRS